MYIRNSIINGPLLKKTSKEAMKLAKAIASVRLIKKEAEAADGRIEK